MSAVGACSRTSTVTWPQRRPALRHPADPALRTGTTHGQTKSRLDNAIAADERYEQVYVAWQCAQQLRSTYTASSLAEGRTIAEKIVATFPKCPIPEIAQLGPTLQQWKTAFLAYLDTGRASNGGTEAKRSTA